MKEPVCNTCHQFCPVRQIDNSAWNAEGGQTCDTGCTGVSWCCDAHYTMLNLPEQIQQEELASRKAQRGHQLSMENDGHRALSRVLNYIIY